VKSASLDPRFVEELEAVAARQEQSVSRVIATLLESLAGGVERRYVEIVAARAQRATHNDGAA
jgi:predicted DNA-binding ribbon-helix-helix protein